MPKLPQYESQVAPAQGGVQPGNVYLPNIQAADEGAKGWAVVGKAGEEAVGILSRIAEQRERRQQQIQMLNASTDIDRGLSEYRIAAAQGDPWTKPEEHQSNLTQIVDERIKSLPENMQPLARATFYKRAQDVNAHINVMAFERQKQDGMAANEKADDAIAHTFPQLTPEQQSNTLKDLEARYNDTGPFRDLPANWRAERLIAIKNKLEFASASYAIDNSTIPPPQLLEKFNNPNFMNHLVGNQRDQLKGKVHAKIHDYQEKGRLALDQSMDQFLVPGVEPNPQAVGQFIITAKKMRDDKMVSVPVANQYTSWAQGVLQSGKADSLPGHYEKALVGVDNGLTMKTYLDDVADGRTVLSKTDFTNIYDRLRKTEKGDIKSIEKAETTHMRNLTALFSKRATDQHYLAARLAWEKERKGSYDSPDEMIEHMNQVFEPFRGLRPFATQDHLGRDLPKQRIKTTPTTPTAPAPVGGGGTIKNDKGWLNPGAAGSRQ